MPIHASGMLRFVYQSDHHRTIPISKADDLEYLPPADVMFLVIPRITPFKTILQSNALSPKKVAATGLTWHCFPASLPSDSQPAAMLLPAPHPSQTPESPGARSAPPALAPCMSARTRTNNSLLLHKCPTVPAAPHERRKMHSKCFHPRRSAPL